MIRMQQQDNFALLLKNPSKHLMYENKSWTSIFLDIKKTVLCCDIKLLMLLQSITHLTICIVPQVQCFASLHWSLMAIFMILIINISLIYLPGSIIMYNGYKTEFCALIIHRPYKCITLRFHYCVLISLLC